MTWRDHPNALAAALLQQFQDQAQYDCWKHQIGAVKQKQEDALRETERHRAQPDE